MPGGGLVVVRGPRFGRLARRFDVGNVIMSPFGRYTGSRGTIKGLPGVTKQWDHSPLVCIAG
jgi:hypothetical protein